MRTSYKRNGYFYEAKKIINTDKFHYEAIYRLGFFAFWMIRFIHGEKKLQEMADKITHIEVMIEGQR